MTASVDVLGEAYSVVESPFGFDLTTQKRSEDIVDEGIWRIMSDWSTCTVLCGGGE